MMEQREAKRLGRPPKPDAEKRRQIGVRTSPYLQEVLQQAAGANGRSVAQEAEMRLERSFTDEQHFGAGPTRDLLLELALQITRAEANTGKPWHSDRRTFEAAKALASDVWKRHQPPPENLDAIIQVSAEIQKIAADLAELGGMLTKHNAIRPDYAGSILNPEKAYPYKTDFVATPEAEWIDPTTGDQPIPEDLRDALRVKIGEWEALKPKLRAAVQRQTELLRPEQEQVSMGLALYGHLALTANGS